MTAPYYQDEHVTLWHGDCRERPEWLTADVLVTDPPYGMSHVSGWDAPTRRIASDDTTDVRDACLALWGGRPAAVFGTWKAPRPQGIRHLLVWDKSDGTGTGMGDLDAAFGNSHEEIYVLGDWRRGSRRRLPSVLRTGAGLRSLSGKVGHPTPKPLALMETLIDAAPLGVIADPFAGSGSTLVAARNLGRKAIGVEVEERYCEVIAKRLAQGAFDFEALA